MYNLRSKPMQTIISNHISEKRILKKVKELDQRISCFDRKINELYVRLLTLISILFVLLIVLLVVQIADIIIFKFITIDVFMDHFNKTTEKIGHSLYKKANYDNVILYHNLTTIYQKGKNFLNAKLHILNSIWDKYLFKSIID